MSFSKSGFVKISASITAALVFLVFISLLLISNVILPREMRDYIKEISKDKGYQIEINAIRFSFLSGLMGNEIEVFDQLNSGNPILRVKSVAVKPEIISSLINRKLKIQEIIVDDSAISLTRKKFENLVKVINKMKGSKKKKEKALPIEIERLTITDALVVVTSQTPIRLKKIEAELGDSGLNENTIVSLSGLIGLKNNEIEIHGEIKPFSDTPSGTLKMNLSQLNTRSFSNSSLLPEKMNVFLDSKFQISGQITSQGVINFRQAQSRGEKNSKFSGKLKYDLTYDKFIDTALVNFLNLDLNELIHASFAGSIEKLTKEAIFDIEGEAKTILIEDLPKWFPSLSHVEFSGCAKLDKVKITGSVKDKNIYLKGIVFLREVNVKDKNSGFQISGLRGGFNFVQTFGGSAPGFFFAQGNFSSRNLRIKTLSLDRVSGSVRFVPSENGITFKSKGFSYENLSFNKATVESGRASGFEFNIRKNNDWTLDVHSDSSQFKMPEEGVYIREFQTDIRIRENGKIEVWGSFNGKKVRYKDIPFPVVSADFKFSDDVLKLTNLKMAIEDYGVLKAERVKLLLGDQKRYTLAFTSASFAGFANEVKTTGIRGELKYSAEGAEKPAWYGNIFISGADIFELQLNNLSFDITPTRNGINLEAISGRFLGGNLVSIVQIKTAESPAFISSVVELRNLNLNKNLSLESLKFRFGGKLERGVLPQGRGEAISRLKLGRDSVANSLSGRIEIKTIGETIIFKDGFIENERGATVKFTGKAENSLGVTRRLQFELPEVPLASIREILSPVLPEALIAGEISGNTSLNLVLASSPKEEMRLDGKLSLKDASFDGKLSSGARILIKDLNGIIHLMEDESGIKNRLNVSIVGCSKPDEKTFEVFLDALAKDKAEHEDDILKIKEIDYGFLRFEDIEFALEVSGSKLNLRRFQSKLYGGNVLGSGLFEFSGDREERKYDFSFLVEDLSLKKASESLPFTKDYITGRINGIGWLSDKGGKISTLRGAFNFWAMKSKKEQRTIGRALLTRLGVKEKFMLRSSRKYDTGQMYGYIREGVITFKELQIVHSILGIQDLLILVDSKRNSISVAHLLSVIRETAKRTSEGKLKIEFENK
jgi:hypothetical protein